MGHLDKRLSVLEAQDDAHGVAVVIIYEGETEDEAIAAHVAAGGATPSEAEISVLVNKPGERPD